MLILVVTFMFFSVFLPQVGVGAVPSSQNSEEYLVPSDSVTVLRGPMSFCRAKQPQNGARPFIYIQFGSSKCSYPAFTTRVGKDRPEDEPVSPGIPFRGRGLE